MHVGAADGLFDGTNVGSDVGINEGPLGLRLGNVDGFGVGLVGVDVG